MSLFRYIFRANSTYTIYLRTNYEHPNDVTLIGCVIEFLL